MLVWSTINVSLFISKSGCSPSATSISLTPYTVILRTSSGLNELAFVGLVAFWHLPNVTTLDWRARDGRSVWRSNYGTRVGQCAWWDDYGQWRLYAYTIAGGRRSRQSHASFLAT